MVDLGDMVTGIQQMDKGHKWIIQCNKNHKSSTNIWWFMDTLWKDYSMGKWNGYGNIFLVNMNKREHCSINMLFYDLFMVKWRIQWENHLQIWINGNVIIPTDEVIFFRGVGQPPTRDFYIYDHCLASKAGIYFEVSSDGAFPNHHGDFNANHGSNESNDLDVCNG